MGSEHCSRPIRDSHTLALSSQEPPEVTTAAEKPFTSVLPQAAASLQAAPARPKSSIPGSSLPPGLRAQPEPPGRTSAGKRSASPALFMAPTLPGEGTVVFVASGERPRCTAARRLGDSACFSHPERRKGETGSAAAEGRVREKRGLRRDKSPPRVAESAPWGWARPGEGRRGRAC